MRRLTVWLLSVLVLAFENVPVLDAALFFDDGGTHIIDYSIAGEDVYVLNTTTVEVRPGAAFDALRATDSSHVDVFGGNFHELYANDSSQVNVSGGSFHYTYAHDSSQLDLSGGEVDVNGGIGVYGSSQVNVSGGSYHELYVGFGASQVDIYGSNLSWSYDRNDDIMGTLADGTTAIIDVFGDIQYATINLHNTPVPEPTTLTLLGLGSLALVMVRRRR